MDEPDQPWLSIYDEFDEPNGELRGNEAGLRVLRSKIDEALANGSASIEGDRFDFHEISISDRSLEDEQKLAGSRVDNLLPWGCLFVVLVCFVVFCAGLRSIYLHFVG
jgi:hypothetical protein